MPMYLYACVPVFMSLHQSRVSDVCRWKDPGVSKELILSPMLAEFEGAHLIAKGPSRMQLPTVSISGNIDDLKVSDSGPYGEHVHV